MIGFCYAVLSNSGVCKIGRSFDAVGRIKDHVRAMEAISDGVERVYLSDQVEDCRALEVLLFEAIGNGAANKNEYIRGVRHQDVINAFSSVGVKVRHGAGISRGKKQGEVLFSEFPYVIEENAKGAKKKASSISLRIKETVERWPGISFGVLRNRLRRYSKLDIQTALEMMIKEGSIKNVEEEHPINKTKKSSYYIK